MIPDIVEQIDINDKEIHLTDEQKQTLLQIFSDLSIRERQCYLMHIAEGLSMSRIAKEVNITKASVQAYINRAKSKVMAIVN